MPGQAAGDNPGFIAPMLATAAAGLPPDAAEFVAEVKWDGLRACVTVAGGRVRAWSRGGRDITAVYPELGALAAVAGHRSLVLDRGDRRLVRPAPELHRAAAPDAHESAGGRAARRGAGHADHLRRAAVRPRGPRRPPVCAVLRRALLEDLGLQVPGAL